MVATWLILLIAVLVIGVWLLYRFKRAKHRFVALILIALILFSFFSFNAAFSGKEISVNNISDLGNVFNVYFSWLSSALGNLQSITANVIKTNFTNNNLT